MKRYFSVFLLAGIFLAGCSSSGTVHTSPSPHKTATRAATEAISGSLASPTATAPVVPVKDTGVFTDDGTVTLKRCSPSDHYRCIDKTAISFGNGNLQIQYGKSTYTQNQNATTCAGSYTNTMPYTVTSGSSAYTGASGRGVAAIGFTATFAKVNGMCDFAGQAKPEKGSAHLSFTANGPITLSSPSSGASA
jgi:hypothetical protein